MKDMFQLGKDAALTPEEYREIRKAVIETPYDESLSGRRVLPVRKVSPGRQDFRYTTVNRYGSAELVAKANEFPGLVIDKSQTTVVIPKIGVSFSIAKEDIESSRLLGEGLDITHARAATKKVDSKENILIWQGDTLWGINGIDDAAGKALTGSDWDTNDPFDEVRQAIATLDEDYVARAAAFNPAQYMELFRRQTNTQRTYFELIRDAFNLEIFKDTAITAGTGFVFDRGSEIAELVVAEEKDSEQDYKMSNQSWNFNVFVRSVPVVYAANAFCKLSSI